jgi:formylglycine-generating enzyme required for sulfatase activity
MKKVFKILEILSLLVLFACGKENAKKESKEKVMAVLEQEKYENEGKVVKVRATDYVVEPNKSDIKNMVLVEKGVTSKENGSVEVIHDFYVGIYEVTIEEYLEFLNSYGVEKDGTYKGKPLISLTEDESQIGHDGKKFFVKPWKDNHGNDLDLRRFPVINVSWYGATAYCNWLSEKNKLQKAYDEEKWEVIGDDKIPKIEGYRLATAKEWEYAARGGENGKPTKYAGSDDADEVAWHSYNAKEGITSNLFFGQGTHSVGEKKSNELGIYDMSGNVCEWTDYTYESGVAFFGGYFGDRIKDWALEVNAFDYGTPLGLGWSRGFRVFKTKL